MSSSKNLLLSVLQPANWQHRSLYGSLIHTRLFLRRQLWVWPVLALVVLSTIGLFVRHAVESTMRANLQSELQTLLCVQVGMLENWYSTQESNARSLANDPDIRELVIQLTEPAEPGVALSTEERDRLNAQLARALAPGLQHHEYLGYVVVNEAHTVVACTNHELLGKQPSLVYEDLLRGVFRGNSMVTPPFRSEVAMPDRAGKLRTGVPTMFVCAPVRDQNLRVIAAIAFRMNPETQFSSMLQLGRLGETGETYAIDREANFVSRSRFEDELILLGLLPDQPDATSILTLQARDPQGNLSQGYRPQVRRSELPLTQMAQAAIAGQAGVNVQGYRDYRGVPVVGAWRWLPNHQIGVATEIDITEAYQTLYILRRTVWSMYALLTISAVAIFVFTILVARANRKAQQATIEARQLGQYQLEEQLGSGAMGIVYRGQHAMLRRPTAIKLLSADRTNDESIQRFEREVQLTCQLNHPNTVMIYDFGRTPEGVFYYAMEYLDGINLQTLVEKYGPQPEARVLSILHQVCGSLYEAHLAGLVHRDIKPANIMLNRRGAEPDIVKVLDFGLVKAVDERQQAGLTQSNSMTGTPLYLSPEGIQTPDHVDARSDLYAVGAVGYFLLTGQPVFQSATLVELCQQHLTASPIPPSQRTPNPVSPELEEILLSCLEKTPGRRPQTARQLAERLEDCPTWGQWSISQAEIWWRRHERKDAPSTSTASPHDRTVIGSSDGLES